MDPNAAYDDLMSFLGDQNWMDAGDVSRALLTWLVDGGFPPKRSTIIVCMHYPEKLRNRLHIINRYITGQI